MAFKINGVIISETSKISSLLWGSGKKLSGVQLNICYDYDLTNLNPPFPPTPPVNFNYIDCDGNSQSASVMAGDPPATVCALYDSVTADPGGVFSQGSRCSS
jgi:hypothetical protein